MQHDWFMYHLRSTYKNRLDFPFKASWNFFSKWLLIEVLFQFWNSTLFTQTIHNCYEFDGLVALRNDRPFQVTSLCCRLRTIRALTLFRWEPEGRYRHRLCTAIAPFFRDETALYYSDNAFRALIWRLLKIPAIIFCKMYITTFNSLISIFIYSCSFTASLSTLRWLTIPCSTTRTTSKSSRHETFGCSRNSRNAFPCSSPFSDS